MINGRLDGAKQMAFAIGSVEIPGGEEAELALDGINAARETMDVSRVVEAADGVEAAATGIVPSEGGFIREFRTTADETYYRVYSGDNTTGAWLTRTAPRSSGWAREALALPPGNTADFIQEVLVPEGTLLRRSRALGIFGRRGGAEQFQLLDRILDENFGPGVPLP